MVQNQIERLKHSVGRDLAETRWQKCADQDPFSRVILSKKGGLCNVANVQAEIPYPGIECALVVHLELRKLL